MNTNTLVVSVLTFVIGIMGGYMYGTSHAPVADEHSMMHESMDEMMMGIMGKSGADLEKAFLKEMIVHHEGAVDMAAVLAEGGVRPELAAFGTAIIDVQSKEIAMMKGWLQEWFGETFE